MHQEALKHPNLECIGYRKNYVSASEMADGFDKTMILALHRRI